MLARDIDERQWLGTVASAVVHCQYVPVTRDLVRVLSTPSILEGEIVKSRLEDEGIPVLLKGGGNDPYAAGAAHVFVPADYEVQARLVLESLEDRSENPEGS
jgi:Putative prokaryotic signal transducing protein